MLFSLVFHPDVIDLDGSIPKGEVLEVDVLDQACWLVLVHQGFHCCLKHAACACQFPHFAQSELQKSSRLCRSRQQVAALRGCKDISSGQHECWIQDPSLQPISAFVILQLGRSWHHKGQRLCTSRQACPDSTSGESWTVNSFSILQHVHHRDAAGGGPFSQLIPCQRAGGNYGPAHEFRDQRLTAYLFIYLFSQQISDSHLCQRFHIWHTLPLD